MYIHVKAFETEHMFIKTISKISECRMSGDIEIIPDQVDVGKVPDQVDAEKVPDQPQVKNLMIAGKNLRKFLPNMPTSSILIESKFGFTVILALIYVYEP